MPPRVLLIAERFAPDLGGVAKSAHRMADSFAEIGAEVHVFSWSKTLQPGQLETNTLTAADHEIVVHRLGLFASLDFSLQYSFNVFDWLFEKYDFDLVWGHYLFPAGFVAVMLAELQQKPSIVSARGNDIDKLMFPPGDFARLQWTLNRASIVTSVSQELSRKIDVILGRKSETRVLGNAVDPNQFFPMTAESDCPAPLKAWFADDVPVLGFCGELRQKKGMPILLETFDYLNRELGARLVIIGAVRSRENQELLQFQADRPHLADHLIVSGHLDDPVEVSRYLNQCDVVLMPSLWDGVPNSILEAMACEKIVVASDAGGIPDVLTHGENGFLVSRHSLSGFATAVAEVLSMPKSSKQKIAREARASVQRQWNSRHLNSEIRAMLSSLGISTEQR